MEMKRYEQTVAGFVGWIEGRGRTDFVAEDGAIFRWWHESETLERVA